MSISRTISENSPDSGSGKGCIIVIDGIDGSGKATQTKMLVDALSAAGHEVETIDFPRYGDNFFGKIINAAKHGHFGDFLALDPEHAAALYAVDRSQSAPQINAWLAQGRVVVIDRYTSSNQIHQGAKCETDERREEFLNWLDVLEHDVFNVPRPDIILYLSMPVAASRALIEKRNSKKNDADKAKLAIELAGIDQTEEDLGHQEASRQSALSIIRMRNNWHRIECLRHEIDKDFGSITADDVEAALFSPHEIHREVMNKVLALMSERTIVAV